MAEILDSHDRFPEVLALIEGAVHSELISVLEAVKNRIPEYINKKKPGFFSDVELQDLFMILILRKCVPAEEIILRLTEIRKESLTPLEDEIALILDDLRLEFHRAKEGSGAEVDELLGRLDDLDEEALNGVDVVLDEEEDENLPDSVQPLSSDSRLRLATLVPAEKILLPNEEKQLFRSLKDRFERQRLIHPDIAWADVYKSLRLHPEKLWPIFQLELTGGEPDIVGVENGAYLFGDTSTLSPTGRRFCVYEGEAELMGPRSIDPPQHYEPRKHFGNAVRIAQSFDAELMGCDVWDTLQNLIAIDIDGTSSYLNSPRDSRVDGCVLVGSREGNLVSVDLLDPRSYGEKLGCRLVVRVPLSA